MSITVMADPRLVASACIDVTGLGGKINGKYYIDKVATEKSGNGACQMKLDLHRVVPRIKSASISIGKDEVGVLPDGKSYTVVHGDTLWMIARRFYGSGIEYEGIYEANKGAIEDAAKGRGKKSSSHGHWIFPGTVLQIPPKEGK